jgi:hypothetical protein
VKGIISSKVNITLPMLTMENIEIMRFPLKVIEGRISVTEMRICYICAEQGTLFNVFSFPDIEIMLRLNLLI